MRGGGLVVEERAIGDSDHTGVGIDGEASAGGVVEAVADRIGAVGIGSERGDAHGRAIGGIFGNRVGGAVAVRDGADVELIDIRKIDGEGLSRGRAVGARGLDGHRMAGRVLVVEQRAVGDGDDAGVGIDGETTTRRVIEAVADRIGTIGIGCQGGDANSGAVGGILRDGIGRAVVVGDGADVGLVGVAQIDGEGLGAGRAVGAGRLDRDRVRGRGLVVQQRSVSDGDDAGVGIDGKPAAGGVVEAVGHRVGTVVIDGQGGHAHGRAVRRILGDRVGGAIVVGDGANVELVDVAQVDREGLGARGTVA